MLRRDSTSSACRVTMISTMNALWRVGWEARQLFAGWSVVFRCQPAARFVPFIGPCIRPGDKIAKKTAQSFEYVEPIGDRVLVRKDEPKRETRGGIALPDAAEIPTITGRIVTISAVVENDEELPLRQYDKILFHPKNAIPVDLEHDNQLFVIPVEDVVAVFRREPKQS